MNRVSRPGNRASPVVHLRPESPSVALSYDASATVCPLPARQWVISCVEEFAIRVSWPMPPAAVSSLEIGPSDRESAFRQKYRSPFARPPQAREASRLRQPSQLTGLGSLSGLSRLELCARKARSPSWAIPGHHRELGRRSSRPRELAPIQNYDCCPGSLSPSLEATTLPLTRIST